MEWNKIFAKQISEKGFKKYKKLTNSTVKKKKKLKMTRDLNRHFPTEDIPVVNRYMKSTQNHLSEKCKSNHNMLSPHTC